LRLRSGDGKGSIRAEQFGDREFRRLGGLIGVTIADQARRNPNLSYLKSTRPSRKLRTPSAQATDSGTSSGFVSASH